MESPTTPRSRRTLVLAALGALLGLGGVMAMVGGEPEPTETASSSTEAKASMRARRGVSGQSEVSEGPCSFAPGTRMAYDVTTRSRSVIDMGAMLEEVAVDQPGLTTNATAMDQQASRRWHVDLEAVARASDGSTVLAAHIDAEPIEVVGRGSQPPAEALADTFLVRLEAQCGIRELGWRTEGDRAVARDQQQLLVSLGWTAPEDGERSYAGTGLDSIGRYHAAHAVADGRVTGQVVDYYETFGRQQGSEAAGVEVRGSSLEVTPRAGEWFASLSNARELVMRMRGHEIGHVEVSVAARAGELGTWRPSTIELDDGGWSWGLLLDQPVPRTPSKIRKSSALAGVAVRDAVGQYLAMIHEGQSSADTVAYLTEWLQANPDGAGELVAMLREGAFEGEQSGSAGLFLALGVANTPQASDALLGIVTGPGDSMAHKISAAHALSKVESPTEAMIDAVVAVVEQDDIHPIERGSMAMALGTFAGRNSDRDPELAQQARERIEGWLDTPTNDEELAGSLLAAGNAGHDDLVGAIEPYLEHEDPQIRQRAAHAMRNMSPEQAYPRLASRLDDDDASVRVKALETATRVSRASGIAPPDDLVDAAVSELDAGAAAREQNALLGLLGEAAGRGHEGASAVLQQHLHDALHSGTRDADELRALGRHTNARWTAE